MLYMYSGRGEQEHTTITSQESARINIFATSAERERRGDGVSKKKLSTRYYKDVAGCGAIQF